MGSVRGSVLTVVGSVGPRQRGGPGGSGGPWGAGGSGTPVVPDPRGSRGSLGSRGAHDGVSLRTLEAEGGGGGQRRDAV